METLLLASKAPSMKDDGDGITHPMCFQDGQFGCYLICTASTMGPPTAPPPARPFVALPPAEAAQVLFEAGVDDPVGALGVPAILKPRRLFTGAQILSACLPAGRGVDWEDAGNGALVRDGTWLSGPIGKVTTGSGRSGLGAAILRIAGPDSLARSADLLQRLGVVYARRAGATFTLADCKGGGPAVEVEPDLPRRVDRRSARRFARTVKSELASLPGASWLRQILSSKGKPSNVAQIRACLGPQIVEGRAPPPPPTVRDIGDGTVGAEQRGVVTGSFCSGLSPSEFHAHMLAGRRGVIDTALSTADTGYLSRCLVKLLETLVVAPNQAVCDKRGVVMLRHPAEPGTMCGVIAAQQIGSRSTQTALDSFHSSGQSDQFGGLDHVLALTNARDVPPRFTGATTPLRARRPLSVLLARAPVVVDERTKDRMGPEASALVHAYRVLSDSAGECVLLEVKREKDAIPAREALRRGVSDADCVSFGRFVLLRALHARRDPTRRAGERARLLKRARACVVGEFDSSGRRGGKWWGVGGSALDACCSPGATCLSPKEVLRCFGVAAARRCVEKQMRSMFSGAAPIHCQVMAAAMTRRGGVAGATRDGMAHLGASPTALLNFEHAKSALVRAVVTGERIETDVDPSTSIMVGRRVSGGTGAFTLCEDVDAEVASMLRRCPPLRLRNRVRRDDPNADRKRTLSAAFGPPPGPSRRYLPLSPPMPPPMVMPPTLPPSPPISPPMPPDLPPSSPPMPPSSPPNMPMLPSSSQFWATRTPPTSPPTSPPIGPTSPPMTPPMDPPPGPSLDPPGLSLDPPLDPWQDPAPSSPPPPPEGLLGPDAKRWARFEDSDGEEMWIDAVTGDVRFEEPSDDEEEHEEAEGHENHGGTMDTTTVDTTTVDTTTVDTEGDWGGAIVDISSPISIPDSPCSPPPSPLPVIAI